MSMLRSRRKSWKQTLELVQKRLGMHPEEKSQFGSVCLLFHQSLLVEFRICNTRRMLLLVEIGRSRKKDREIVFRKLLKLHLARMKKGDETLSLDPQKRICLHRFLTEDQNDVAIVEQILAEMLKVGKLFQRVLREPQQTKKWPVPPGIYP